MDTHPAPVETLTTSEKAAFLLWLRDKLNQPVPTPETTDESVMFCTSMAYGHLQALRFAKYLDTMIQETAR